MTEESEEEWRRRCGEAEAQRNEAVEWLWRIGQAALLFDPKPFKRRVDAWGPELDAFLARLPMETRPEHLDLNMSPKEWGPVASRTLKGI